MRCNRSFKQDSYWYIICCKQSCLWKNP